MSEISNNREFLINQLKTINPEKDWSKLSDAQLIKEFQELQNSLNQNSNWGQVNDTVTIREPEIASKKFNPIKFPTEQTIPKLTEEQAQEIALQNLTAINSELDYALRDEKDKDLDAAAMLFIESKGLEYLDKARSPEGLTVKEYLANLRDDVKQQIKILYPNLDENKIELNDRLNSLNIEGLKSLEKGIINVGLGRLNRNEFLKQLADSTQSIRKSKGSLDIPTPIKETFVNKPFIPNNADELMSFEQVYRIERGVEFNPDKVRQYIIDGIETFYTDPLENGLSDNLLDELNKHKVYVQRMPKSYIQAFGQPYRAEYNAVLNDSHFDTNSAYGVEQVKLNSDLAYDSDGMSYVIPTRDLTYNQEQKELNPQELKRFSANTLYNILNNAYITLKQYHDGIYDQLSAGSVGAGAIQGFQRTIGMDTINDKLDQIGTLLNEARELKGLNDNEFDKKFDEIFAKITGGNYNPGYMQEFAQLTMKGVKTDSEEYDRAVTRAFGKNQTGDVEKHIDNLSTPSSITDIVAFLSGSEILGSTKLFRLAATKSFQTTAKVATKLGFNPASKGVQTGVRLLSSSPVSAANMMTYTAITELGGIAIDNIAKKLQAKESITMKDFMSVMDMDYKAGNNEFFETSKRFSIDLLKQGTMGSVAPFIGALANKTGESLATVLTKGNPTAIQKSFSAFAKSETKTVNAQQLMNDYLSALETPAFTKAQQVISKTSGFITEVAGFTGYSTLEHIAEGLLTGELDLDSLDLGEEFKGQLEGLGTLKGIARFIQMKKSGAVAKGVQDKALNDVTEHLKDYEITDIDGQYRVLDKKNGKWQTFNSPEEAVNNLFKTMFIRSTVAKMEEESVKWQKMNIDGEEVEVAVTKNADGVETADFSNARKLNPNGEYEHFAVTPEKDLLSSEADVKEKQMTREEFLSYIDTLEFQIPYQGKKGKWKKIAGTDIEKLADLYMEYPDETMQVMRSKVEPLKDGGWFTPEDAIKMINIFKNYNEIVKNDKINASNEEQTILDSTQRDSLLKEIYQILDKDIHQGTYDENDILQRFEDLGFDKEKCLALKTALEIKVIVLKNNSVDRGYEYLGLDDAYDLIDIYGTGDKLNTCFSILENGLKLNNEGFLLKDNNFPYGINKFWNTNRKFLPPAEYTISEFIDKATEYLNLVKGNESLEQTLMPDLIMQKNSMDIISDALKENPDITFEELVKKFNENNISKLDEVKDSEMKRLAIELLSGHKFLTEKTMQMFLDICNKPKEVLEYSRTIDIINNLRKTLNDGVKIKLKDELKNISDYTDKVVTSSNMPMQDIKNKLTQIGVFDHIIDELSQKYGDNKIIPSDIINFANEFFNLGKIKFGKEYNRDIKDGYIDPEKYITAEKNRTLRGLLSMVTDKSGKPNINELNKIIDYLTEHVENLYVDDLYRFLTYGKNKNGEIDLESVKKVKNAITKNQKTTIGFDFFDSVSTLRHHFKIGENSFLNDSYDYESYNKLLDAVIEPWDVGQMNLILGSIGENIETKKVFINNPRPTIEFIEGLQSKGIVRYRDNESDIEGLTLPVTEIQTKALNFIKKAHITRDDRKELFDTLNNLTETELPLLEAFFDKYDDANLSSIIEHIAEFREYDKESQDTFIKALKNDVFSHYECYDKKKCIDFKKSLVKANDVTRKLLDAGVTNLLWGNIPDFFNGSADGNYIKLSKEQSEFALRLFEICQEEGNSLSTHDEINNLIANAHPDTYEFIENYLKAQKYGEKYYRTVLEAVNKSYAENKNAIQEYQDFIKENPEYADKLDIEAGLTALDKVKILAKDKELLNSLFADESYNINEILTGYEYITHELIEKSMQNLPELTSEAKSKFPNALGRLFLANLSNQSNKNIADIYNIISKYDKDVALRLESILTNLGSSNDTITHTSNIDYLADCIKNESTRGRQYSDKFISNIAFLTHDIKEIVNIADKEGFPRFKFEELMEKINNENVDSAISILKIYNEIQDPDTVIMFAEKNITSEQVQELLGAVKANQNEITPEIFSKLTKVLNNENVDSAISMLKNYKEIGNPDVIIGILRSEERITYKQVQQLKRAIGKDKFNKLNSNDLITACKFISLHGKSNINEIPIEGKKDLLHSLVSSNTGLFNISEDLSKEFPLLPKSQEEYCSLLPSIVRSLGIETNELTPEQRITMFNSSMGELSKSLADISDTDFAKMTITQEYPKDQFIRDILDKVKDMSRTERQKVYDYFGFELHHNKNNETGFSITGYPVNLNNGKKLAQIDNPNTKAVVEEVRPLVIRFSQNNKIKCDNPKVEQFLNEVVDALPELRTAIGRKQHGSQDFDVMQHSLKVMQKITQDPKFSTLNDSDKKIMLLASLMHDITKSEGRVDKTHANEGSFDTYFIAQKFNLTKEEEVKLHTLIKNHEWLEYANTAKSEVQLTKRLQSVAYDLHQGNLFDMAEIFTHADLRAVRKDDSFHDTTEGRSRISFDGTVRSFGQSADIYAQRIRGYAEELKKSQPLLPQTKIPRASRINDAITQVNPDGSTNIKGVYKDKDGLVIIKFNEVEDWEAIGFPKGSISHGVKLAKGTQGDAELSEDVNTGNIKFFVHALEYSNQLAKFDAFSLVDSDALLSVSYAERPESKFRFFRAQGVILDVNSKYIHGGGNHDSGSGYGKDINEFKRNYIFGGYRQSERTYVSDLIKKTTGMSDEQYVKFVEENKDKSLAEIEPAELREKLIQAFATINSNTRKGNRSYNEMYISNPNEVMAVFAYDMDYSRTLGNPVEFLGKTQAGAHEKGYNGAGRASAYDRTEFLRQYALERNLPFIVFGD